MELLRAHVPRRSLTAIVATHNAASLPVLEKVGFKVVGPDRSPACERYPECERVVLVLE